MVKVAINGFGRIGRNVLRAIVELGRTDIEVVAINDLAAPETSAHLLQYDSVHGRFPAEVALDGDTLIVAGKKIRISAIRNPADLPWSDVDVVMECTGIFRTREAVQAHLENGSSKVLISAPAKSDDVKTIVYGVNHDILTSSDIVVSNASCTTNCLAPVAKVLNDAVGIEQGYMTTIHAYTGDQPILDKAHRDLQRARAAAMSMIPTTTGAAKAVTLVLPELKGKLDGSAIRVPTPNVSCVDLKFNASRQTSVEEINQLMKDAAAKGPLKDILGVTDLPLVSIDFNHNSNSSTFATLETKVMTGNLVRILTWYDNEWGFSCRMADTAVLMGSL